MDVSLPPGFRETLILGGPVHHDIAGWRAPYSLHLTRRPVDLDRRRYQRNLLAARHRRSRQLSGREQQGEQRNRRGAHDQWRQCTNTANRNSSLTDTAEHRCELARRRQHGFRSGAVDCKHRNHKWRAVPHRRRAGCLGPPGTGKSHLAQAIGQSAIQQGYRVLYRETHKLLDDLAEATIDGTRKECMELFVFRTASDCRRPGHAEVTHDCRRGFTANRNAAL